MLEYNYIKDTLEWNKYILAVLLEGDKVVVEVLQGDRAEVVRQEEGMLEHQQDKAEGKVGVVLQEEGMVELLVAQEQGMVVGGMIEEDKLEEGTLLVVGKDKNN